MEVICGILLLSFVWFFGCGGFLFGWVVFVGFFSVCLFAGLGF